MTDWHAAYLTDPTVMDATRRRCAATGEDGWAAATELAATMPPGFGHHEAAGARAVIAPASEPDRHEQDLLTLSTIGRGYYGAERYGDTTDMPVSMAPHRAVMSGKSIFPLPSSGERPRTRVYDWMRHLIAQRRDSPSLGWTYHPPSAYPDSPAPSADIVANHTALLPEQPDRHQYDVNIVVDPAVPEGMAYIMTRPPARFYVDEATTFTIRMRPDNPPPDPPPSPEVDSLHALLELAERGTLDRPDAVAHPAISEATRRRLITLPPPARRGRGRRRASLTELGRVELRRIRVAIPVVPPSTDAVAALIRRQIAARQIVAAFGIPPDALDWGEGWNRNPSGVE